MKHFLEKMGLYKLGGDKMFEFNTIEEAIEDIKKGKIVIVIDDPDRENEGDLVMAAEMVTGKSLNFMAKYGRGLICMPIEEKRMKELNISPMVTNNTDNHNTAFTVSIDCLLYTSLTFVLSFCLIILYSYCTSKFVYCISE